MTEKIDELRALLDEHDRSGVTIVSLAGVREVTELGDSWRRFKESGDIAYIVLGPKEKMNATRTERDDGTIIYSFTLNPE